MTRMLHEALGILNGIYDKHGDMPIVGENYQGNHGEIYIALNLDHEEKVTRVILNTEEEIDYDDDCASCGDTATTSDEHGIPLCEDCYELL